MSLPEEQPRYEIAYTERAELERDQVFLNLLRYHGTEFATRWYVGLEQRIAELTGFPGPLALAVDEQATGIYKEEVRRELYHGGKRQRTSALTYRILFTIKPPFDARQPHTILILRILHGSQSLSDPDNEDAPGG